MKLIPAHVNRITETHPGKKVELIGRTCYKSEDKITEDSYLKFIQDLIARQHYAMIEHATFVFQLKSSDKRYKTELQQYINLLDSDDYIEVSDVALSNGEHRILASANARAVCQRNLNDPLFRSLLGAYQYLVFRDDESPAYPLYEHTVAILVDLHDLEELKQEELDKHLFATFKFTVDRGVTHEMVRHRPFSFAQESTRYCNYSRGKYGSEITYIEPSTYDSWSPSQKENYKTVLEGVESAYLLMTEDPQRNNDGKPLVAQQARAILPQSTKADIIMTGRKKHWDHFFDLRSRGTTGAPHPDMKLVADAALCHFDEYLTEFPVVE